MADKNATSSNNTSYSGTPSARRVAPPSIVPDLLLPPRLPLSNLDLIGNTPPITYQQQLPMFTAAQVPHPTMYQLPRQPPPPLPHFPMFDKTIPPPPLPRNVQAQQKAMKRRSSDIYFAQPKIARKLNEELADAPCDQCMQQDLRVQSYKDEMNELFGEDECQTLRYRKKLEEYQNSKNMLQSLVSEELFSLIEDYVESVPQNSFHDILSDLNQPLSASSVPQNRFHDILSDLNQPLSASSVPQNRFHDVLSDLNQPLSASSVPQNRFHDVLSDLNQPLSASSVPQNRFHDQSVLNQPLSASSVPQNRFHDVLSDLNQPLSASSVPQNRFHDVLSDLNQPLSASSVPQNRFHDVLSDLNQPLSASSVPQNRFHDVLSDLNQPLSASSVPQNRFHDVLSDLNQPLSASSVPQNRFHDVLSEPNQPLFASSVPQNRFHDVLSEPNQPLFASSVPQNRFHDVLSDLNQPLSASEVPVPGPVVVKLMKLLLERAKADNESRRSCPSLDLDPTSTSDAVKVFMNIIEQSNSSDQRRSEMMPSSTSNREPYNNSNNGLHFLPNSQSELPLNRAPPTLYPAPPAQMYYPPPFPVTAGTSAATAPPAYDPHATPVYRSSYFDRY